MSITDELREWAKRFDRAWFNGEGIITFSTFRPTAEDVSIREIVESIADRIDAEHERMHEALTIGMEPMTDENMARDGWVKLPVDADGVPIHVGDEMEWPDGSTFDVVGISANTLFYVERDFDDSAQWTAAHNKRHHQPDTWERIIEDAVSDEAGVWFHTEIEASRYIEQRKMELVERCKRLAGEA